MELIFKDNYRVYKSNLAINGIKIIANKNHKLIEYLSR